MGSDLGQPLIRLPFPNNENKLRETNKGNGRKQNTKMDVNHGCKLTVATCRQDVNHAGKLLLFG